MLLKLHLEAHIFFRYPGTTDESMDYGIPGWNGHHDTSIFRTVLGQKRLNVKNCQKDLHFLYMFFCLVIKTKITFSQLFFTYDKWIVRSTSSNFFQLVFMLITDCYLQFTCIRTQVEWDGCTEHVDWRRVWSGNKEVSWLINTCCNSTRHGKSTRSLPVQTAHILSVLKLINLVDRDYRARLQCVYNVVPLEFPTVTFTLVET